MIDANTTGVTLRADDDSMMHVVGNSRVTVAAFTDAKMVFDANTALVLTKDIDFTMKKKTDIFGAFDAQPTTKVYIIRPLYLTPQILAMEALNIAVSGSISTPTEMSSQILIINATDISVNGNFSAGVVILNIVHRFYVGNVASVTFEGSSDLALGNIVEIHGKVNLKNVVSFRRSRCESITIDGSLVMDGGDNLTLECKEVHVNGFLSIQNPVNVESNRFIVDQPGEVIFMRFGVFVCDKITVNGIFTSMTHVMMRGHTSDNIDTISIGLSGRLTLDNKTQEDGTFSTSSAVAARIVQIYGTFRPGQLHTVNSGNHGGWDSLKIGVRGSMKFQPEGDFVCNYIKVSGHFESYTNITVRGHNDQLQMIVDAGASVLFNNKSDDVMIELSQIAAQTVRIDGTFLPGKLQIIPHGDHSGWDSLEIGVQGIMKFQPEGDFVCNYIKVSGHFESYTNITVRGHNAELQMIVDTGASVLFNNKSDNVMIALSQIAAQTVRIDGTFLPGKLQIIPHRDHSGWESLEIGAHGIVKFQPEGDFLVNSIKVNGNLEAYTPIKLQGHSARLEITIAYGASVLFDSRSDVMTSSSIVMAQIVNVEGTFLPKQLQVLPHGFQIGWDSLEIGVHGIMEFQPEGDFVCNNIKVSGNLESYTNITVRGHNAQLKMIVDAGASVLFNNKSDDVLVALTQIAAQTVRIDGTFLPGQLQIIPHGEHSGWESLEIGTQGIMKFQPEGDFLVNSITVNGNLEAYTPIKLRGHSARLEITIAHGASVLFDSQSGDVMTSYSTVAAKIVKVEGKFLPKQVQVLPHGIQIGWDSLEIGVQGIMKFQPEGDFVCNYIKVSGNLESYTNITIHGHNARFQMIVDAGASVLFNNKSSDLLVALSQIAAQTVRIDGTFLPGQLQIIPHGEHSGWESLEIGTQGIMKFQPEGDFLVNSIMVNGNLEAYTPIKLRGHSARLEINIAYGANVLFDSQSGDVMTSYSTVAAKIVKVEGTFLPKQVQVLPHGIQIGWDSLEIGVQGIMKFQPEGDFVCNNITVKGHLESYTNITVRGHNTRLEMVIDAGASVLFNNKSDDVFIALSQIAARIVKVDGTFLPRRLQVIPHGDQSGWDSLEIGVDASMKFQPEGDFLVNHIKVGVRGNLEVYTPIKLSGHSEYLQIIIASGASILFDSKSDIMNVSSTVAAESVQVEGTFLPKQLQIISHGNRSGWDSLEIGVQGIMKFQPWGDFVCNYIKVRGNLESYTNITVRGHDARLQMIIDAGASVLFNNKSDDVFSALSQIAAQIVNVYGTFLPRRLQVIPHRDQSGWDSLEIGLNAIMKFQPEGDFLVNHITVGVNGNLEAYTPIKLRGHSQYLQITIASGASILFDSKSDVMNVSSTVAARSVKVEGTFLPKQLQVLPHGNQSGWESLVIGVHGIMKFQPDGDFVCNYIKVRGNLESYTNITVRGHDARLQMIINYGASVLFNNKSDDVFSALSQIAARIVNVYGTFLPGRLQIIPHGEQSGWDSLEIGLNAIMKFQPEGDFLVNSIKVGVNGHLEAYTPIKLWGHSQYLQIIIASGASILFDSKSDVMNVSSTVAAESVQVEGTFLPKQLQIISHGNRSGWDSLEIGTHGIMKFQPWGDFVCNYIKVSGLMESYTNITVHGHSARLEMIIDAGASVLFNNKSDDVLIALSQIAAQAVKVNGTFLARRLQVIPHRNESGWDSLEIGADAIMKFQPEGDFLVNSIKVGVNGHLEAYTPIKLWGHSQYLQIIIASGASILFDSKSDIMNVSSTVAAESVQVEGTFLPKQLQIISHGNRSGWDSLEIGVHGIMKFQPEGDFVCNYIKVSGHMESYTNITVHGHSARLEMIIDAGARHLL